MKQPFANNEHLETPAHPSKGAGVGMPQDKAEREKFRRLVHAYATRLELVPPLSMEELRGHADAILQSAGLAREYRDFITVLVGNEVWWNTMAGIPFDRRVLMIPQCLRKKAECPAEMDELGLLCAQCGRCPTGDIQSEAEAMGYVVLVAEGTTVVTKLLEQGRVDAVIGVSCLSVLERAFPHMAAHAIPGLAVPLVKGNCDDSKVDLDWVREAIRLRSDTHWPGQLDIDALRKEVDAWFTPKELQPLLAPEGTRTEEIAIDWLSRSGKRWRPLLAVCVYKAVTGTEAQALPQNIHRIAIAMECFHKASLVHDDIEDEDNFRYGEMTLHNQHGVPVALNVGDLLLGEGYRLLAGCGMPSEQTAKMLAVVAEGHRNLCLGQGEELCWVREPAPLSSRKIIDLFRRKTAPAFGVALRLGALAGGANDEVGQILNTFSEALGIAYQIRDDLEDSSGRDNDTDAMRPSLLLALAYETASPEAKAAVAQAWRDPADKQRANPQVFELIVAQRAEEKARQLLEHYKNEAIRSLSPLRNAQLKALLQRLVGRILG